MSKEFSPKDFKEAGIYYQEMAFVHKTGVLDFLKKSPEFKKKNASIKSSSEGKYFVEVSWPIRIEDNKPVFENVISFLPNVKKETLLIMGLIPKELKKKEWSNQKILKKTISQAFKSPFPRSNREFYTESEKI